MKYEVRFTAVLGVEVIANDLDEARALATEQAILVANQFDTTVTETDWISIHTDDIVSVEQLEDE